MDNEKRIRKFLGATVSYDNNGQYFFAHIDDTIQMVAELRGWGAIQHLFAEHKEAAEFQDELGEWIADAINQKIQSTQSDAVEFTEWILQEHDPVYEETLKWKKAATGEIFTTAELYEQWTLKGKP